jgi:hypothetical protein
VGGSDGGGRRLHQDSLSCPLLVFGLPLFGLLFASCSGAGTGHASSVVTGQTTQPSGRQENTTALVAFGKSVTADDHNEIGPQPEAIRAAVAAGYQVLANAVTSSVASEHSVNLTE